MNRKELCKIIFKELNKKEIKSICNLEKSFKLYIDEFKKSSISEDSKEVVNNIKEFNFLQYFNYYPRVLNDYVCHKYLVGMLYLSPKKTSGIPNVDLCEFSGTCANFCFDTKNKKNNLNLRRVWLTYLLMKDETRNFFLNVIVKDILKIILFSRNKGLTPAIRLNGLSDIPWEKDEYDVTINTDLLEQLKKRRKTLNLDLPKENEKISIFKIFKTINFYDYTKYPYLERFNTINARKIINYHLTFSYDKRQDVQEIKELLTKYKRNVTFIVMKNVKKEIFENISKNSKYLILDGDNYDCRVIDNNIYSENGKIILLEFVDSKTINIKAKEFIIQSVNDFREILNELE